MTIYDVKVDGRNGERVSMEEYKGQVVMVINSATECGFTPQYDQLQDMYEKYADEGFVILDFPCNQFGNQAPGSDEEIVSFCDSRYGITFPIFSKVKVNGDDQSELFAFLKEQQGFNGFDLDLDQGKMMDQMLRGKDPEYDKNNDIKWNFTKFLIDRDGNVVQRFEPTEDMGYVESKVEELI